MIGATIPQVVTARPAAGDVPGGSDDPLIAAADLVFDAMDAASTYREIAVRLADHLRRIVAAGDAAAKPAKLYPRMGIVSTRSDRWQAYRQATIDAGLDLDRIERAAGDLVAGPTAENGGQK